MSLATLYGETQDTYLTLIRTFPLRPLRSEAPPIPPASDAELLQHLLEAQQVTPGDVARATGIGAATLAAVLAGTHHLTREHIGTLARYFQVSPSVFALGE